MQLEQIKDAIVATPKGANIILEWVRPVKTKKSVIDSITKAVRMVGRIGVDYDNQAAVQAKRESGDLPAESQPIWNGKGQWLIFPYLFCHVDTGETYLRLYKGTSTTVHPKVHFFRNGLEVSADSIKDDILASEKAEKDGDCFCCKTENVTRIHHESEWMMLVVGQVGQEKVATAVPVPARILATL